MPALTIYGRRWHTTTDMLPIPATLFFCIYSVYLAVYAAAIARLHVWTPCKGDGVHYIVTTAGLISVFGLSVILQAGIIFYGLQGTCFEVRRRHPVICLLYAQTGVWALQAFFMVYGTVILYLNSIKPTCWVQQRAQREGMTHAMIWSTWGQAIFLLLIVYLTYNSYHGQRSLTAWEKRLKALSFCLRCGEEISRPMQERGPALPSIAQWISRLFASVDLSPTDLTEAVILAAAAQSLKRKMHIQKALKPALARASGISIVSSSSSSSSESTEDLDLTNDTERSDPDRDVGQAESDAEEEEVNEYNDETDDTSVGNSLEERSDDLGSPGNLEEICKSDHDLALPKDYPKEWAKKADKEYTQTALNLLHNEALHSKPSEDTAMREVQGQQIGNSVSDPLRKSEDSNRTPSSAPHTPRKSFSRTSTSGNEGLHMNGRQRHHRRLSSTAQSGPDSSLHSIAGSDPQALSHKDGIRYSLSSRESDGWGSASNTSTTVELREVSNRQLEAFAKEAKQSPELQQTPKERYGLYKKKAKRKPHTRAELREGDAASPENASTTSAKRSRKSGKSGKSKQSGKSGRSRASAASRRGDTSLPESLAGGMQAGLNEAEGGLPSEAGGPAGSEPFSFQSAHKTGTSTVEKDAQEISSSIMPMPELGPDDTKREQIITPSGEMAGIVGTNVPLDQALEETTGKRQQVDYESLQESSNWARFASAVYAVMPFVPHRKGVHRLNPSKIMTEKRVRDAVVEIANIENEDLLYFSHSDIALSHLPYMIALDRKTESVVVAIRGTMSLADLVTDAVVHPECLSSWLPIQTRKAKRRCKDGHRKAFTHSGITSAAKAVLEDLEASGVLPMLLQPDAVRKSAEKRRSMSSGEARAVKSKLNTAGTQVGGALPFAASHDNPVERSTRKGDKGEEEIRGNTSEDKRTRFAENTRHAGEATGEDAQKKLDRKGWKLVLTGHSLGAGAAALISMKIHDRYPDLKCWAFSPPGGLVSKSLLGWMEGWCTSVVVGKDAVPRMTVNNLSRLMDDMVTSLARVRWVSAA